jgi:DNA/RNA-binding domain of Phe-tRNA-synthetase-like protein
MQARIYNNYMFDIAPTWKTSFPNAHAAVLVMRNVTNPAQHPELEKRKAELEEQIRAQFAGQDRAALANHPVLQA